jgi:hypothetical protein
MVFLSLGCCFYCGYWIKVFAFYLNREKSKNPKRREDAGWMLFSSHPLKAPSGRFVKKSMDEPDESLSGGRFLQPDTMAPCILAIP